MQTRPASPSLAAACTSPEASRKNLFTSSGSRYTPNQHTLQAEDCAGKVIASQHLAVSTPIIRLSASFLGCVCPVPHRSTALPCARFGFRTAGSFVATAAGRCEAYSFAPTRHAQDSLWPAPQAAITLRQPPLSEGTLYGIPQWRLLSVRSAPAKGGLFSVLPIWDCSRSQTRNLWIQRSASPLAE